MCVCVYAPADLFIWVVDVNRRLGLFTPDLTMEWLQQRAL